MKKPTFHQMKEIIDESQKFSKFYLLYEKEI